MAVQGVQRQEIGVGDQGRLGDAGLVKRSGRKYCCEEKGVLKLLNYGRESRN